jgi:hypothetical protein
LGWWLNKNFLKKGTVRSASGHPWKTEQMKKVNDVVNIFFLSKEEEE